MPNACDRAIVCRDGFCYAEGVETLPSNPEAPPTFPQQIPPQIPPQPEALAVAGFVLGLISLVLFCQPMFSVPLAIAGIVCASLSKSAAPMKRHGLVLSISGLVCGIVYFGILIAFFALTHQMRP